MGINMATKIMQADMMVTWTNGIAAKEKNLIENWDPMCIRSLK